MKKSTTKKEKTRKNKIKKHYLAYFVIVAIIFVVAGTFMWRHTLVTPPSVTPLTTSPSIVTNDIFAQVPLWNAAKWSFIKTASTSSYYGTLTGKEIDATMITQQATISHFEDIAFLQNLGFDQDRNLSADGPGSSVWGYKKTTNNTSQVVLFSYTTLPVTVVPNEPIQFSCPCTTNVSVFVSDPFSSK